MELAGVTNPSGSDPQANQMIPEVLELCRQAKAAQPSLAAKTGQDRAILLTDLAQALVEQTEEICQANQVDMATGKENGLPDGLLDRLLLTPDRLEQIAQAVCQVRDLPDPVGQMVDGHRLPNGLEVSRVRVPMGVIAMIYEARPNVTVDAACLCLKSSNAVILRGGSAAENTNQVLVKIFQKVLSQHGLPKELVATIDPWGRTGAQTVMRARGLVDLLIPRGGAGLIQSCVQNAQVPVIETGVGNCHIYVDASANLDTAVNIVLNAKTQRVGVCNAAETLLIDRAAATEYFPTLAGALTKAGVKLHADVACLELAEHLGAEMPELDLVAATETDFSEEYLALEIAVAIVDGVQGAIDHIRQYSSGHTEAIVARDQQVIESFVQGVDSAVVAVNASTRFTDGGQLGLGAEIGISTQKMHARGPFALTELTTVKWIIKGQGHIRG